MMHGTSTRDLILPGFGEGMIARAGSRMSRTDDMQYRIQLISFPPSPDLVICSWFLEYLSSTSPGTSGSCNPV